MLSKNKKVTICESNDRVAEMFSLAQLLIVCEKDVVSALRYLPYGTKITVDDTVILKDEDEYGFSGTECYYYTNTTIYVGVANKKIVQLLSNGSHINFEYVGSKYHREPMFT